MHFRPCVTHGSSDRECFFRGGGLGGRPRSPYTYEYGRPPGKQRERERERERGRGREDGTDVRRRSSKQIWDSPGRIEELSDESEDSSDIESPYDLRDDKSHRRSLPPRRGGHSSSSDDTDEANHREEQMTLKEREDILYRQAIERIQRAERKGRISVKLGQDEIAALSRRHREPKDQDERRPSASRRESENSDYEPLRKTSSHSSIEKSRKDSQDSSKRSSRRVSSSRKGGASADQASYPGLPYPVVDPTLAMPPVREGYPLYERQRFSNSFPSRSYAYPGSSDPRMPLPHDSNWTSTVPSPYVAYHPQDLTPDELSTPDIFDYVDNSFEPIVRSAPVQTSVESVARRRVVSERVDKPRHSSGHRHSSTNAMDPATGPEVREVSSRSSSKKKRSSSSRKSRPAEKERESRAKDRVDSK
jgi:hypothetical protein